MRGRNRDNPWLGRGAPIVADETCIGVLDLFVAYGLIYQHSSGQQDERDSVFVHCGKKKCLLLLAVFFDGSIPSSIHSFFCFPRKMSALAEIEALSRSMLHEAEQLSPAEMGTTAPATAAAAAPAAAIAGAAVAAPASTGQMDGARLFVESEKLQLLIRCLQALHDAAPSDEPRIVAFSPSGMYLTVACAAPNDRNGKRCHELSLPDFFFAQYRCANRGFGMILDLQRFITALTKIYTTAGGRCVQLIDRPNNTLLIRAGGAYKNAKPLTSSSADTVSSRSSDDDDDDDHDHNDDDDDDDEKDQTNGSNSDSESEKDEKHAIATKITGGALGQDSMSDDSDTDIIKRKKDKSGEKKGVGGRRSGSKLAPVQPAANFAPGHVMPGQDGRMWRVSVRRTDSAKKGGAIAAAALVGGSVHRWVAVRTSKPESIRRTTAASFSKTKSDVAKRAKVDKRGSEVPAGEDHKFFEFELIPMDASALSGGRTTDASGSARGGAASVVRCERIPWKAYLRYPQVIEVGATWMHNMFKRLQQDPKVTIEFDGATRKLQFESIVDGAPCREGDVIPHEHILPNPFLPQPSATLDTRTVVVTRDVSAPARDRVTESDQLKGAAADSARARLAGFRFREDFSPATIWKMVKPNKLCAFVDLYLAPGEPLVLQFVLQRDKDDSRRAATFSTWMTRIQRKPNPHVRMPPGGAEAVTRKMLELAPRLGSTEQTFAVCSQAIHLTGGDHPAIKQNAMQLEDGPVQQKSAGKKQARARLTKTQ